MCGFGRDCIFIQGWSRLSAVMYPYIDVEIYLPMFAMYVHINMYGPCRWTGMCLSRTKHNSPRFLLPVAWTLIAPSQAGNLY